MIITETALGDTETALGEFERLFLEEVRPAWAMKLIDSRRLQRKLRRGRTARRPHGGEWPHG